MLIFAFHSFLHILRSQFARPNHVTSTSHFRYYGYANIALLKSQLLTTYPFGKQNQFFAIQKFENGKPYHMNGWSVIFKKFKTRFIV